MKKDKEPKGEYKFNEDNYVEELQRVIDSTYTGHYSRQHFQATEFIIDGENVIYEAFDRNADILFMEYLNDL